MKALTLFPHQQKALDDTKGFNRVAYYLDMGLGKTFVGSEKLKSFGTKKNLLICQKSKVNDWVEHFNTYYEGLNVIDYTQKDAVIGSGIIVINYELTFRRKELFDLSDFSLMVDESSLIQNESTKRSKFVLNLQPKNLILLSGTPTAGKYENLYSQLHLLGWTISKELYWKQYIETQWVETDEGFFRKEVIGYKNVDRLKMKLKQHGAIFMKSEEVLDLPEQVFNTVRIEATKEYRKFMKSRVITIEGKEMVGDSALTQRLYARMLCGHYNQNKLDAYKD
jgi:SNF2 family DNA or RNA helicase